MLFTTSVPFSLTHTLYDDGRVSGVKVEGLVRVEEDGVALEFRETTTRYGPGMQTTQGEVRTVRIPDSQLESVTLHRPLIGAARLILQVRSLEVLKGFPYAEGPRCVLAVARRDRAAAREVAAVLIDRVSEARLRMLERGDLS